MTIQDAAGVLSANVLVEGSSVSRTIGRIVASDLMSDVLLVDDENIFLLTSLASDQVLRTAQIVGAAGVVVVNDKPLPSSMPAVARDLGMALMTSPLPKYEACVALYEWMKTHG